MNGHVIFQDAGSGHQDRGEGKTGKSRWLGFVGSLVLLFVLLIAVARSSDWLVDWFWMKEVGYTEVFLRLFSLKGSLFFISFVTVFLYLWINLRIAVGAYYKKGTPIRIARIPNLYEVQTNPWITKILMAVVSLVPALLFGLAFLSGWDTFLRYYWGGTFGQVDPFFGKDLGFYMFRLPYYGNLRDGFVVLFFLALPATFLGYLVTGQIEFPLPRFQNTRANTHLAVLFVLFLLAWGAGYYFDIFQLFYEKRGVVFGMGYTSYHVVRIGLWVMMAATLFLAVLAIMKRNRVGVVLAGIGGYIVVMLLSLGIIPALFQSFVVQPNELSLEKPFLEKNIAYTRKANQ
jgi:hypothetical protein